MVNTRKCIYKHVRIEFTDDSERNPVKRIVEEECTFHGFFTEGSSEHYLETVAIIEDLKGSIKKVRELKRIKFLG